MAPVSHPDQATSDGNSARARAVSEMRLEEPGLCYPPTAELDVSVCSNTADDPVQNAAK